MKKFLWLFLLFLCQPLYSQRVNLITIAALIDTSTNDSSLVNNTAIGTRLRVFRSSTSRDTLTTKWVLVDGINGELTLEFRKIAVLGTDTVEVVFQAFRGYGTPDSTGITDHSIVISAANLTANYKLSDSTWVKDRLYSKYRFKIFERAVQQNDYILNINQYSPSGKRIRLN